MTGRVPVNNLFLYLTLKLQVFGVHSLIDIYYEQVLTHIKTVNDLVVVFMKDHPRAHFFIDELPACYTSTNQIKNDKLFQSPDLRHLAGL